MTPAQCRAARRLLSLSREEVAAAVDISPLKLAAFEAGMLTLSEAKRVSLRKVFELAGVEFGRVGGVRLKLPESLE